MNIFSLSYSGLLSWVKKKKVRSWVILWWLHPPESLPLQLSACHNSCHQINTRASLTPPFSLSVHARILLQPRANCSAWALTSRMPACRVNYCIDYVPSLLCLCNRNQTPFLAMGKCTVHDLSVDGRYAVAISVIQGVSSTAISRVTELCAHHSLWYLRLWLCWLHFFHMRSNVQDLNPRASGDQSSG